MLKAIADKTKWPNILESNRSFQELALVRVFALIYLIHPFLTEIHPEGCDYNKLLQELNYYSFLWNTDSDPPHSQVLVYNYQ